MCTQTSPFLRESFIRRHACSLLILLCSLSIPTHSHAAQDDIPTLALGRPVERQLAGGQSHSYRVVLTAGQYLHVIVIQHGIDVVVKLFAPDGKQLIEVDSPNGTEGPEPVFAIARASGAYLLEVRSLEKDAAAGRYEVKIEELRTAE